MHEYISSVFNCLSIANKRGLLYLVTFSWQLKNSICCSICNANNPKIIKNLFKLHAKNKNFHTKSDTKILNAN